MNYYLAARGIEPCPVTPRQPFRKVARSFGTNILAVIAPAFIVGGLITGIVTPTEAGIVAVFFSILVGFIYKEMSFKEIRSAFMETVKSTSIIMVLIGVSSVISWIYTYERLPHLAAQAIFALSQNKYVILLLVNVFLLFMGCLIEPIPLLLISTPILVPLMQKIGVDLVHFGVVICYNITLGMITPPMGIGLYVMMKVVDISFEELVKAVLPFLVPLIGTLLLFTFYPPLSLALVNLFW
jgi:tripartite ATP-independent transporter DctM subunit